MSFYINQFMFKNNIIGRSITNVLEVFFIFKQINKSLTKLQRLIITMSIFYFRISLGRDTNKRGK